MALWRKMSEGLSQVCCSRDKSASSVSPMGDAKASWTVSPEMLLLGQSLRKKHGGCINKQIGLTSHQPVVFSTLSIPTETPNLGWNKGENFTSIQYKQFNCVTAGLWVCESSSVVFQLDYEAAWLWNSKGEAPLCLKSSALLYRLMSALLCPALPFSGQMNQPPVVFQLQPGNSLLGTVLSKRELTYTGRSPS